MTLRVHYPLALRASIDSFTYVVPRSSSYDFRLTREIPERVLMSHVGIRNAWNVEWNEWNILTVGHIFRLFMPFSVAFNFHDAFFKVALFSLCFLALAISPRRTRETGYNPEKKLLNC